MRTTEQEKELKKREKRSKQLMEDQLNFVHFYSEMKEKIKIQVNKGKPYKFKETWFQTQKLVADKFKGLINIDAAKELAKKLFQEIPK